MQIGLLLCRGKGNDGWRMEDLILISNLNDFIYCPASIYFHGLYGNADKLTYQSEYQINGTKAHENVDAGKYSTRKNIITALEVFSQEYGLVGKIDIYDREKKILIERKKHVNVVYDGYVFQLGCMKLLVQEWKEIRY